MHFGVKKNQNTPVTDWGINFINKLDFSDDKKILDIGCRQGRLSHHLAEKYPHTVLTAIDQHQEAIQCAKGYYIHKNLTFEHQDLLTFDVRTSYDSVVSFSCLHWVDNKFQLIKNIYQSLKPGGKAYLQFFALHGREKNDRFLYQVAQSSQWKSHFNGFKPGYSEVTLSQVGTLLQAAGFIIHRMEFQQYRSHFENADNFQQWLKTWATHQSSVPIRKQDHFLAETVNAYLAEHQYAATKCFPYDEYVLEIVCEKPQIDHIKKESGEKNIENSFTSREFFVLTHYLQGKSPKEIASLASVSTKTIEFHVANIKRKLHCKKKSDIFNAAIDLGFVHLTLY